MLQIANETVPRKAPRLRGDELAGLAVAIAAHIALLVALAVHALRPAEVVPLPERVTVSLAQDVSMTSTAPKPAVEAQAAVAPTLADVPAPAPAPKPEKRPETQPRVSPIAPQRTARKPPPVRPPVPSAVKKGGGSLLGDNFLPGQSTGQRDANAAMPASQIGPSEKASLQQAIARQLRPYWKPPSGADAEDLVTILAFDLNPDGTLAGRPRVVQQFGVTDANRPQAGRHAELAIRAVQLAAPFKLPPEYYNAWKRIKDWRFDWKSAQ